MVNSFLELMGAEHADGARWRLVLPDDICSALLYACFDQCTSEIQPRFPDLGHSRVVNVHCLLRPLIWPSLKKEAPAAAGFPPFIFPSSPHRNLIYKLPLNWFRFHDLPGIFIKAGLIVRILFQPVSDGSN